MTAIIADQQISSKSTQYVPVPISNATSGDPTGDAVSFAFPLPGEEPVTFYTGSWQTISGIYYARCLVGPTGAVALAVGYYDIYVKIGALPETPVLLSGLLEVT